MRSMAGSRVATYLAAATIVGASAAVCAPDARGDDVLGSPAGSQVTVPSVDATVAAATDAVGAATDLVAGAVAAPAAPPSTPEEEPASEGAAGTDATASPAPAPAPAAAIQPQSSLDQSAQSPETTAQDLDITSSTADTAGDTGAPAPAAPSVAPSSPAVAVQASPTNVNVSVRIGSAGDNGPVTQVNVATAATAQASPSTAPSTSSVPTSSSGTPSTPAISPPASATSAGQDADGTWTWEWDCISSPDFSAISGVGSTDDSIPRNWTWIWNCAGNDSQYQGATSSQYQPSNVNVSIRVSSPGNDGPVSQANVAVAVGAAPVAVDVPEPSWGYDPGPSAPPLTLPGLGALPALPGFGSLPALPGFGSLPALPGFGSLPALPGFGSLPALPGFGSLPALPGFGSLPALPGFGSLPALPGFGSLPALPGFGSLPALPGLPVFPSLGAVDELLAPVILPVAEELGALALGVSTPADMVAGSTSDAAVLASMRPSVVLVGPLAARRGGASAALALRGVPWLGRPRDISGSAEALGTYIDGQASSSVARAAGAEGSSGTTTDSHPAPRWKAPAPGERVPATTPSGASVAPAVGGGSSGGGIPIFLALPFLAAMADLARRVTLDRVALPSGHRSRVPEDPG